MRASGLGAFNTENPSMSVARHSEASSSRLCRFLLKGRGYMVSIPHSVIARASVCIREAHCLSSRLSTLSVASTNAGIATRDFDRFAQPPIRLALVTEQGLLAFPLNSGASRMRHVSTSKNSGGD